MNISQLTGGMPDGVQASSGRGAREQRNVNAEAAGSKGVAQDVVSTKESSPKSDSPAQVNEQQLREALENVSKAVSSMNSNLEFTMDEETGIRVVKVVDKTNGEVIRQMPSEEVVEMAKSLEGMKDKVSVLLRDAA